jgi:hypothetical protein
MADYPVPRAGVDVEAVAATSSYWRADTPRPELPAVEITEDVPADLSETL